MVITLYSASHAADWPEIKMLRLSRSRLACQARLSVGDHTCPSCEAPPSSTVQVLVGRRGLVGGGGPPCAAGRGAGPVPSNAGTLACGGPTRLPRHGSEPTYRAWPRHHARRSAS